MAAASPRLQTTEAHLSLYNWLAQVIFVLVFLSVVIFICLTPHFPLYTVLTTSLFTNDGNLTLDLQISNPNQGYHVHYTHTSLILESSIVGTTSIPDFDMGCGGTTVRRVAVNGTRRDNVVVRGGGDRSGALRLRLLVGVRFEDKVIGARRKSKEVEYEAELGVGFDGRLVKEVAMARARRRGGGGSSSCVRTSRKLGIDRKNL